MKYHYDNMVRKIYDLLWIKYFMCINLCYILETSIAYTTPLLLDWHRRISVFIDHRPTWILRIETADFKTRRWYSQKPRERQQRFALLPWSSTKDPPRLVKKKTSIRRIKLENVLIQTLFRLYCRHHERTFSTAEEELLYFLKRMGQPKWKWPLKPHPPEHMHCKISKF